MEQKTRRAESAALALTGGMLFGGRSGCPTDIRLALSLLFPASFVSPHSPGLLVVPAGPFSAVGHQKPFSWRGVTLTGKESLL